MRILHSCEVLQDSILQTGVCASWSSHTLSLLHYSYSKRHQRSIIFSGKLLWRSDECVLLPCFNMQPDIFAVMNCFVVALIVISSDMLAWMADSWYSARPWASGLGVKAPLSLIFYKKFITCANEINCFRILFAC